MSTPVPPEVPVTAAATAAAQVLTASACCSTAGDEYARVCAVGKQSEEGAIDEEKLGGIGGVGGRGGSCGCIAGA
eukprot:CAMPEP_0198684648 /NCGR_PEP_ID=MMETSP1468-20131203/12500_1 /TAXON_ID=1461545 /ORGANISM="Mantoniella sp, Strain CCMP1436" /LENGTH=74 /DNA_ID=CAMNT_0044429595 /DNA_START=51 /DNA_END=271 /DNA_ORIENTATION=-